MEWRLQPRPGPQAARVSRQRVILLAGLPGSGKTTVAVQLQSLGWVWVNQDTLGSRRACEDALVAALAAGQEVVVDRCNFDMAQRSTFLNLARRFRALVIALQFTVPVHECIRRAKARPNHPTLTSENTADIIQRFARDFVGVHPSEGIDEVYTAANQVEVNQFVSYVGPAQQKPPGHPGLASRPPPISQPFPGQRQPRHAHHADDRLIPDFPGAFTPGPQLLPAYAPPPFQHGTRSQGDHLEPRHAQSQAQPWFSQPSDNAGMQPQQQQQPGSFGAVPWMHPQQQQQLLQQQLHFHTGQQARCGSASAPRSGTGQSSIVPFPRNDSKWQSAKPSAKVLAQPRFLDLEVPKAPNDTRPIALFDLNGTLTSHTAKRRSAGVNKMRPGVHHLMRLHDTFRIGIFTSASSRTVETVVPMLENAAGSNGRPLLAEKDFILTRSHTVAAPSSHIKEGGNTWDTVKPLNQWFKDLSRVILVDDDAYKAVSGEENNMIVVPCWQSNDDDAVLAALTDALLDIMGNLSPDADVRRYTKAVQESVALAVGQPVGGAANPEEIDLEDADDSMEEERQEHAIPAPTNDAAQQSHLVMV